ncbi:P-aminobenzoate N-oxygenase AurF [Pseudomonas coleopterorum]|nr:P-aminobenzoate N-oxygenase AurF [Pseudomonas coleopterorum]
MNMEVGPQSHDGVRNMLEKLSSLWDVRAAVNNDATPYSELLFEHGRLDFSESLVPFRSHPNWQAASAEMKSRCLSYGWIIYNLKTIYIECDIVTPACEDIIKRPPVESSNRDILQRVMSEALLDEALHTKMSVTACNYIYLNRKLPYLDFTDFNLIRWRDQILATCTAEWQRRLTRFGIACASETLITDYLKTLSEDDSIQQVCHEVTRTHAVDEWSHSSVFSFVACDIVHTLSVRERAYLQAVIAKTVEMFADNEMGAWAQALSLAGFQGHEAMLMECSRSSEVEVYTESVFSLLARIGLE